MPEPEETIGVRVQLSTITYAYEFTEILSDLDRAYNAIYFFFDLAKDVEDAHRYWRRYWPGPEWPAVLPLLGFPISGQRKAVISVLALIDIKDLATYVDPSERLTLKTCQIGSPGFLDFIGMLNPLEVFRQWAQDRHERRKDREYREPAESERLRLENEILRNQAVKGRIDILRELGGLSTSRKGDF